MFYINRKFVRGQKLSVASGGQGTVVGHLNDNVFINIRILPITNPTESLSK